MPHYFFGTRCNSEDFVRDEAGLELDNIEAARDEATCGLADLARDTLPGATRRELATTLAMLLHIGYEGSAG